MLTRIEEIQARQIAVRIKRWAAAIKDVEKTCGYCMSGMWHNFYQSFLFPDRKLRVDVLDVIIQKLDEGGLLASLDVSPIQNGIGLYMYMRLRRKSITTEGLTLYPKSVFIGLQRELLPSMVMLHHSLTTKHPVNIPARFLGEWELLSGVVTDIAIESDGILAFVDPDPGSLCKSWKTVPVWIPNSGMCGILTTWK